MSPPPHSPPKPTDAQASAGPLAPWQLERYLLGELPPEDLESIRRRLDVSAEERDRLEALRRQDAEQRRAYPAPWMARQIRARSRGRGKIPAPSRASTRWWRLAPVAGLALVAAAALPLLRLSQSPEMPLQGPSPLASAPGVRLKGDPHLVLHRRTSAGSERLERGASARAGDLLLIQYHGAGRRYGAILSIDGRGAVTVHLPSRGTQAATLSDSGLTTLGYAYELDDAPRCECFYFVTGDAPFGVDDVAEAVRRSGPGGSPELPPGLDLYTFELDKSAAPPRPAAPEVPGR